MKYRVASYSLQGARRSNQDRVAVAERGNAVLMVLADGLGGHKGGEIAADIMTQWAVRAFTSVRQPIITQPSAFLALTILQAHNQIVGYGKSQKPPTKPRTTCVLCLVQNGYAYWAHVGDSRLYHYRDGVLLQRTVDHSTIEKLHQEGLITEDEMQHHPQKNTILKCVGGPNKPAISLGEEVALQKGDRLLLCSDGVWDAFSPDELHHYLARGSLEEGVEEMLHDAEKKMGASCDNISAVCLRWDDIMTTGEPLQGNKAGVVDQKTLWETAKKKKIDETISASAKKIKKAESKAPPDKKDILNTIEQLEDYLSQYLPKKK